MSAMGDRGLDDNQLLRGWLMVAQISTPSQRPWLQKQSRAQICEMTLDIRVACDKTVGRKTDLAWTIKKTTE
jgi:hypothetical protein